MADAVGYERNTQTDKQSQIHQDVLTDFCKLLEVLQYENDTAVMKDYYRDGFYSFQKTKNSRSVESGVGGVFNTQTLSAEVEIRFFCIHSWDNGVETRTASCEQDGEITFTCSKCGGKRVQIIPALDHTVVRMEDKAPTCTEAGYENWTYCSVCGNELSKTEIYAKGHIKVSTPEVAPTCTESGWTEGVACSICKETLVVREEIPATGHVEEVVHGHAATCTEEGLSDGVICAVCDEVLKPQSTTPVADHKDEEPLDHMCDACGYGPLSDCTDNDGDGYCDVCGVALGKDHVDSNNDHFCDDCGARVSWCRDCNRDHDCDICGKTLMHCIDFNHNHICDICWTRISDCEDEDGDHRCDYCRRRLSRCADTDNDHLCDVCGKLLSECADLDRDGRCDICGMDLSWVVRLAGSTRAETAREAAEELKALLGVQKFDAIVYTSGYNFPDALTGTYFANEVNAPVLLYYHAESAMNLEYIKNNLNKNGTVYILGGKAAMPEFIEKEIVDAGMKVERLGGATRFETNIEILEETGFNGGETVLVCTGYEFADSLSASATGMPILLVNNSFKDLRESQIKYLESLPKKCNYILIGGTNAISKDLEEVIMQYDADGKVERVGGATRFETSLMVAEKFFPNAEQAVLAYGWMFPDALCGGTVGYTLNAPVVLASDAKINAVADYIEANRMVSGYVMGGTVRLTDEVICKAFDLESADQIHTR